MGRDGGGGGTRRGVSTGQWIGTGLLLVGVLTGQIGVAGLLLATWLENVAAGVATVRALVRGDRERRAEALASSAAAEQVWPPPPGDATPPGAPTAPPPVPPPVAGRPVWEDPSATPAAGERDVLAHWRRTGKLEISDLSDLPAGCAVPFFIFHYGMFTFTHGTFLAVGGGVLVFSRIASDGEFAPSLGAGLVSALVLAVATLARAFRDVEPAHAVKEAYAGVITLHLAIVFGGALGGVFLQSVVLGDGPELAFPVETLAALALVALFAVSDLVRAKVVAHDRARDSAR